MFSSGNAANKSHNKPENSQNSSDFNTYNTNNQRNVTRSPILDNTETMHSENETSNNVFSPALSYAFKEKIRPVLMTINELRSQGLQQEIQLPAIAVVGDQSVGKSSVLEAISGIEFPRGLGVVTRCPLQLSMNSRDDNHWCGRLYYTTKRGDKRDVALKHPSEIEDAIREAQNAITEGSKTDISENLIEMSIEGPDCPDLTLIDLPGIARFSAADNSQTIAAVTKNLILSYVQRPEVIILVVIPCHIDIETVEALSLAKEVDPEGKRTIGVLTCPDMINRGAETEVMSIAKNQKIPLTKGFVTVRCRSPQELKDKRTLQEAAREEELFFKTHSHFRHLDKYECGSKTLANKLSCELFSAIKDSVPSMLKEIQSKREKYARELIDMGTGPPEDKTEMNRILVAMLHEFCTDFDRVATGTHRHEEERLYSKCRVHWEKLADDIEECAYLKCKSPTEYFNYVKKEIEEQRGRELPLFDNIYPVLERIVRDKFLMLVKEPTSDFLVNLNQEVDNTVRTLADKTFLDFPLLNSHVKTICEKLRSDMVEKSRDDINKLLVQENFVFTQDRIFLREGKATEAKTDGSCPMLHTINECSEDKANNIKLRNASDKTIDNDEKEMNGTVSKNDMKENNPSATKKQSDKKVHGHEKVRSRQSLYDYIDDKAEDSTKKVIHGVTAYIQVATRRMMDYIPMNGMHYMLYEMSKEIAQSILQLMTTPEELYVLMEEDPVKNNKRLQLKDRIDMLQYAEHQLAKL